MITFNSHVIEKRLLIPLLSVKRYTQLRLPPHTSISKQQNPLISYTHYMYDDSKSQDMIERKIKNAPAGQGTVRMLTREEWESVQEVRPRTPFESKLARPNAKLRTGEPLKMEDVKDWTIDVITDALTRAEECAKRGSN
ncbi:uncharacterized protein LOC107025731 isoform X3 [Solanum pennellii]|nr:uncharacterized protein LOC107025731 isoform X3 [Solanum pennellii]